MDAIARVERAEGGLSVLLSSGALFATTVVGSALGFLFWLVASRGHDVAWIGTASAWLAAVSLAAMIGEGGLGTLLTRFAPTSGERQAAVVDSALSLSTVATVAVSAVVFAVLSTWQRSETNDQALALFLGAAALCSAGQMLDRFFTAYGAARFVLARGIIANVVRILTLALATALGVGDPAVAVLLALAAASAVSLAAGGFLFSPRVLAGYRPRPGIDWSVLRGRLTYSLASHLSVLLWNCPPLVFPIIVLTILGPAASGRFYVTWMIANLLLIVPTAVSTAAFAMASSPRGLAETAYWGFMRACLLGLAPLVAATYLLGGWALRLFGAEYAVGTSTLLGLLAVSALPYTVNTFAIAHRRFARDSSGLVWLSAVVAVTGLIAGAALGAAWGLPGVACGWLGAQALGLLASRAVYASIRRDSSGTGWTEAPPAIRSPECRPAVDCTRAPLDREAIRR